MRVGIIILSHTVIAAFCILKTAIIKRQKCSVADWQRFDDNPDPNFFHADPDPTFHFDADPDSDPVARKLTKINK